MVHAGGKVRRRSQRPGSISWHHEDLDCPAIDFPQKEFMSNASTSPSVKARLTAMAARRSGLDVAAIELSTPLTDLGIDSLGLAELMFDIDDEFKIEISDEQMVKLNTVGDLIEQIEQAISGRSTS